MFTLESRGHAVGIHMCSANEWCWWEAEPFVRENEDNESCPSSLHTPTSRTVLETCHVLINFLQNKTSVHAGVFLREEPHEQQRALRAGRNTGRGGSGGGTGDSASSNCL